MMNLEPYDIASDLNKNIPLASPVYITDHTVPFGWSYKGEGSLFSIKSPTGTSFRSRRQAFEAMVVSGKHSFGEINNMKQCLQYEGWQENDRLPDGWRIKIMLKAYWFMEQGGRRFQSITEAVRFVQTYQKYYKEGDAELLSNLFCINNLINKEIVKECEVEVLPEVSQKKIAKNVDEFYQVYPPGWKFYVMKNGEKSFERIVSNDGTVLRGKRAALAYMVKNNYRSEEKEKLEKSLQKDGWYQHPSLPGDWLYKNSSRGPIFSNEKGVRLESTNKAVEYLTRTGKAAFSQKLETFGSPNQNWIDDPETYPSGWKYIQIPIFSSSRNMVKIKTSTGETFKGKRAALEFMIKNKYSQEDVEKVRKSLISDGWSYESTLPPNWLYRKKTAERRFSFINEHGVLMKRSDAISHFKNIGDSKYLQILTIFRI